MRRLTIMFALLGPGLLTAATGVGAGDLATAGFAGSRLGVAVLWTVAVGAFVKFVLGEGLARWQLVTGETILEGAIRRMGPMLAAAFLIYFLPWSFFTGAALLSACGVTTQAFAPGMSGDQGKLILAAAHSVLAVALVWGGGYKLVERVMAACIAVMFVTVIATAIMLRPDPGAIATGLVVPTIPQAMDGGLTWTIALVGGVGGTLTIICYGYWIKEKNRTTVAEIKTCRIDLGVGYALTGLFGMAMLVIANGMTLDAKGAGLIVALADRLEEGLGPAARWVFLVGAWAAVFSSLLGVLQAVPYVFTDFLRITRKSEKPVTHTSAAYRVYLVLLALVPLVQIAQPFKEVQKWYAIVGAAFVPMLAVVLLVLNGRRAWMGEYRNKPATVIVLALTVALALVAGYLQVRSKF